MKKLIILLSLSFMVSAKPKPKYRIEIQQSGVDGKIYIPQVKIKTGILSKAWRTVDVGSFHVTLKDAERVINDLKFEDSIRSAHRKRVYIYF